MSNQRSKKGSPKSSRSSKMRRWLLIAVAAITLPLIPAGILIWYYSLWALSFDVEKVLEMPATTFIYDRDGYVIQRLFEENRVPVGSEDIPEVLRQAVIAKEDQRFNYHPGFDPVAITRSFFKNIRHGGIRTGASTITQQLARNSAGMFERTPDRKIREIFLAVRLEMILSKDEILTLYMNRIFFGGNIYGIGAASEAYFGKHPSELNLPESALLAGIIAAPNSFSPWRDVQRAREVRRFTLSRMVACGFISKEEATAADMQPLVLRPRRDIPGSYVAGAVQEWLPSYISREILYRGGLHIHTSIDLAFQRHAENEIERHLTRLESTKGFPHNTRARWLDNQSDSNQRPDYLQAAFVAIHNADGGILALVGGRNYAESTFNRALLGSRQIGSTVKPFVYAHAFNTMNFTGATEIDRSPFNLREFDVEDVLGNRRADYISTRRALSVSDNYAAMRTGLAAGVEGFCHLMEQASGQRPPPYPSSFLGAFELTPLQVASAYSMFANYGVIIEPHLIVKVSTSDEQILYQHIDTRQRVLSPQIAFQICHLLQDVIDAGTGRSLRGTFALKGDLGGKTGTTNDFKDSWFAGFSKDITAALWVGFDQPRSIMPGAYASRVAVPLWGGIMKSALTHYPTEPLLPPHGVRLAKPQTREKVFLFFSQTRGSDSMEYLRDDQLEKSLLRLEPGQTAQVSDAGSDSWLKRTYKRIFNAEPEIPGHEPPVGEMDEDTAVIQNNSETRAPRAQPVAP